MRRKISAAVSAALMFLGLGFAVPAASAVESSRPTTRIRCDFYYQGQCYDHWIPTPDSCKGVGVWGTAWQQAVCMALNGVGQRG